MTSPAAGGCCCCGQGLPPPAEQASWLQLRLQREPHHLPEQQRTVRLRPHAGQLCCYLQHRAAPHHRKEYQPTGGRLWGRQSADEAPRQARLHWGWEASAIGKCWVGALKSILLDSALSQAWMHLRASAVTCQPYTEGQELLHQEAERLALAS